MIESALIPPVFFIRWRESTLAADVPTILRKIEEAHRETENLVYVSVVPVGVPPPDSEARAALLDGTHRAKEFCASIHVVIEGHGLRRALIRSVSAGLILATRGGFQVHSNLRDALQSAAKKVPMDVEAVLAKAAAAGMVSKDA